ncbi:protoporphyrinogen oxidase [Streptomyces sp. GC420]|uniref:protoporphyrinogen oxidase n=1 Tax=Streptomyces sp. GC420 TaxID=2697568 RepID=UPI001414D38E|nr:protoporphyrinogen oxidase [Streptomyces sp. GC420]NBM20855.1 protoporphyrinogen oxidase [Streptomyces sp. GC420]
MNERDPGKGHVIVIGGGITGLAAAHRLLGAGARVTVLEAGRRLGGKLHAGEIEGRSVDLGAESVLARRPEAVDLARAAGLGDALQPPATTKASVWSRGALRPMPAGHVMGVPGDPAALAASGVLSDEGLRAIAAEKPQGPFEGDDVAIGEYVAEHFGREVVDRLVEPLLGGVYAGDAYRISMRAAVPQLFEAVREHGSLAESVRAVQERTAAQRLTGPVFMGIEGGIGRLPVAVAEAVRAAGGTVLTRTPVLRLTRRTGPDGTAQWEVVVREDTAGPRALTADAVVLAVPAPAAATLLSAESPAAAAELAAVEYASMALVTMAFRRADAVAALPEGSGFLVPPVEGHAIKASTFSSAKWRWAGDEELFLLRTSLGRQGEAEVLDREDGELVELSRRDLAEATGLAAAPVASRVDRWYGGLPQYPVGHLGRVARVREHLGKLPGLRVCGAAYDGVGIPACVASGVRAADEITKTLTKTANGAE